MSRLLDFYLSLGPDVEGRSLAEIWAWTDDELEAVHDYIQWLFPLPERSNFNPLAPLLSAEEMAAFRSNPNLRANLHKSFERILEFLGLALTAEGTVVEGSNFAARKPEVWAFPNHNWLRITRILRSLTLLGLEEQARAFHARLVQLRDSSRFPIPENTFRYWTDALKT